MDDRELNRQTFLALSDADADFSLPHRIEHVFVGATDKLREVDNRLGQMGFDTRYETPSILIAMQWARLDIDEMNEQTAMLTTLASRLSCQFDGWGTAPRRKAKDPEHDASAASFELGHEPRETPL